MAETRPPARPAGDHAAAGRGLYDIRKHSFCAAEEDRSTYQHQQRDAYRHDEQCAQRLSPHDAAQHCPTEAADNTTLATPKSTSPLSTPLIGITSRGK